MIGLGERFLLLRVLVRLPHGVPVPPHVHLGEAADVAHPHHVHRKVPEEVHNLLRLEPNTDTRVEFIQTYIKVSVV